MPSKANVIVEYGPYRSNGIVEYKEDRLIGLKSRNLVSLLIKRIYILILVVKFKNILKNMDTK